MRIRPIRVVPEYEGAPQNRDIAERSFLRALEREKARGPALQRAWSRRASTLGPPARPRVQGQTFGQAFANINTSDYDRAAGFSRAIDRGAREAQRREDAAREAAQDANALRAMGFHGRDDDDL